MKCSSLCSMCLRPKVFYINFTKYHGICENEQNFPNIIRCIHCNSMVPVLDYSLVNLATDIPAISDKTLTESSQYSKLNSSFLQNHHFNPEENPIDSFKLELLPSTHIEFGLIDSNIVVHGTSLENPCQDSENTSPLLITRLRNPKKERNRMLGVVCFVFFFVLSLIIVSILLD